MTGFDLGIFGPALVVALMTLAVVVPLGRVVVEKGAVFPLLVLVQASAAGVTVGLWLFGSQVAGWLLQLTGIATALGFAMVLLFLERYSQPVQQVLVGLGFLTGLSLQALSPVLGLGNVASLQVLVLGEILWVTSGQLVAISLLYGVFIALWYFRNLYRERVLCCLSIAVIAAVSVQVIGVVLTFATFLVPALAAREPIRGNPFLVAFHTGILGYVLGLLVVWIFSIPAGISILIGLVVSAVVFRYLYRCSVRHSDSKISAESQ